MKNVINLSLVVAVFVFVLGCSCGGLGNLVQPKASTDSKKSAPEIPANNDSLTDQAIETVADGETTGVQECDDLVKFLSKQTETKDDNWVTKGIRDFAIGKVKKTLRENLEKNKDDKVKMAEQCKDLRDSFVKSLNSTKGNDPK